MEFREWTEEVTGYKWNNLGDATSAEALGLSKHPNHGTGRKFFEPFYNEGSEGDFYYYPAILKEFEGIEIIQTFTVNRKELI